MEKCEITLAWSPLFSITEDEKNSFLEKINNGKTGNGNLSSFIFDTMYKQGYDYANKDTLEATRRAILNHLIFKTDFALDTLSTKNYENARECYNNCQYDSDILDTLIKYFTLAWGCLRDKNGKPLFFDGKRIFEIIKNDVDNELKKIKNQHAQGKYAHLKAVIDTVCTVNYECYLNSENDKTELENDLNTYIIDTYGYDFNEASEQTEYNHSEYFKGKVNEKLQLALLNDDEFWQGKSFSVTSFLNQIYKENKDSVRNIIDYIFNKLQKENETAILIKNGLSIGFRFDALKKKLKEYAIFNGFNEKICYPLFDCDNEIINEGKKIFDEFLYDYTYPHCKDKIKEFLINKAEKNDINDVFAILNNAVVGISIRGSERSALYDLNKEFFNIDAIYKRAYIKSYYLSKLYTPNEVNHALFECFYYLTEELNRTLDVNTSFQLDDNLRKEKFNLLKNILSNYGAVIEYNKDYIVCMVDEKSAITNEIRRFSSLQNLGSAIYDFALGELVFYNPYLISPEGEHDKYSDYKSKIEIAKKINLSEAYICHVINKRKRYFNYSNDKIDFNSFNDLGKKDKYLSDFLDMVLGAYSLDKGHNSAILLAKTLIIDTFPDIFTNNDNLSSVGDARKEYINDYLNLLSCLENKWEYFNIIHRCFYNLLGNLVLRSNVDNASKLDFYSPDRIAPLFGDTRFFTEITPPFRCYLEYGIDEVISQYGNNALESFKKDKK